MVQGGTYKRYEDAYDRCSQEESKKNMGYRETKARQCQTFERNFFMEPNDEEFKLTLKAARRKLEVRMPAGNALQNTDKDQWRKPPQHWETQDELRLCC